MMFDLRLDDRTSIWSRGFPDNVELTNNPYDKLDEYPLYANINTSHISKNLNNKHHQVSRPAEHDNVTVLSSAYPSDIIWDALTKLSAKSVCQSAKTHHFLSSQSSSPISQQPRGETLQASSPPPSIQRLCQMLDDKCNLLSGRQFGHGRKWAHLASELDAWEKKFSVCGGSGRYGTQGQMASFMEFFKRLHLVVRRKSEEGLDLCAFCRNNGEPFEVYITHKVKDSCGRVTCPVLRLLSCPWCRATGDQAHTIKYCPYRKRGC